MIAIFTGLPGAGKSYKMAQVAIDLLHRNKKIRKKYGIHRVIVSNIHFSEKIEKEFEGYIKYWSEPAELIELRHVDVLCDEIATHLDSTQWANMSLELKRWLQQHRKFGVDIYGTTQDFSMIDKSMRRMTSDLKHLTKLIGSRDKSSTKPPVKHIWAVVSVKTLDPTTYEEENKVSLNTIPSFMFITKEGTQVFDTGQEIKAGEYPPLNHIDRHCGREDCSFHRVIHA